MAPCSPWSEHPQPSKILAAFLKTPPDAKDSKTPPKQSPVVLGPFTEKINQNTYHVPGMFPDVPGRSRKKRPDVPGRFRDVPGRSRKFPEFSAFSAFSGGNFAWTEEKSPKTTQNDPNRPKTTQNHQKRPKTTLKRTKPPLNDPNHPETT